ADYEGPQAEDALARTVAGPEARRGRGGGRRAGPEGRRPRRPPPPPRRGGPRPQGAVGRADVRELRRAGRLLRRRPQAVIEDYLAELTRRLEVRLGHRLVSA